MEVHQPVSGYHPDHDSLGATFSVPSDEVGLIERTVTLAVSELPPSRAAARAALAAGSNATGAV